jgi:YegS/Rv2252/BmrU family lipid kinase
VTWVAIVNANAGTKPRSVVALEQCARERSIDIVFHQTQRVEDVASRVGDAAANGTAQFVAVGGDGTVHVLVNALMELASETRFTVAVIPSGSGSDLTRTFGHTTDLESAFDRIASPELYGLDIGRISSVDGTTRYFVNVADIGVAAAAVRLAKRLPRWMGRTKYTAAFWLTLSRSKVPIVEVQVDHHRFRGEAINIVIANGQFFGGGMNIAPRASMADGKFDVQVFTGKKRQAFAVMPRVLSGSHLSHPAVRRYVGSRVIVDGPDDLDLESDGELVGSGPVTIDILPDAIDLVI